MGEWKEMKLGDICDVRDGTHDSPKQSHIGKSLVTSKNLKNGNVLLENTYLISEDDFFQINKRSKVDRYDILFSMIGTVGEIAIVKDEPDFAIKNVGLFKCNQDYELAKWIYYYMKSSSAREELQAAMKGSTQAYISLGDLRNFPILLPERTEQKSIASVLSSLDDKIDLLHRQNKTLEAIAETLFRQWFVEEAREDWEDRTLGEFFPVVTGKKDANYSTDDGLYPFFTCSQTAIKAPGYSFDAAAILLSGNGDFNVKRHVGKFEAYQRTYVLIPDDILYFNFLFTLIRYYLPDITGSHQGSVINFITKGMITDFAFKFPEFSDMIKAKLAYFDKIYEKVDSNFRQISLLEKLRDSLLPKLMSGEVRVG